MRLYLAVDGGNSKTDVVIGTETGDVLAYERGPGTCHQNIGLPETIRRLQALVSRATTFAGLGPDTAVERAELYLAGADLPQELALLIDAVRGRQWADSVHVDNDTFALLRAGTDAADAVAVVCGAGINCVGRTGDGRTTRFPSLGPVSGDWGGGGGLGLDALWHAVRAEDGRGPATALAPAIAEHSGQASACELSAWMHLQAVDLATLADLAPLVFEVAAAGDPVAGELVARQADEIVTMAMVAARRLNLLDTAFAVVLGGGVLRARHPLLVGPVSDAIIATAPKATITIVDAPPVLGAALNALDAMRAQPAAHQRAREQLADRTPGTLRAAVT